MGAAMYDYKQKNGISMDPMQAAKMVRDSYMKEPMGYYEKLSDEELVKAIDPKILKRISNYHAKNNRSPYRNNRQSNETYKPVSPNFKDSKKAMTMSELRDYVENLRD